MEERCEILLHAVKERFHGPKTLVPWRHYSPGEEGWEETEYFKGRDWHEISIGDFNVHPYCFSFFHYAAFPFFWGAMMASSIKARTWECRALENFLVMWDNSDLSELFLRTDPAFNSGSRVSSILRGVLSKDQVDVIQEYFVLRFSFGATSDATEVNRFIQDLRAQEIFS